MSAVFLIINAFSPVHSRCHVNISSFAFISLICLRLHMLRIWRANKRRQELGGDAHLYAAPFRKRCLTGASLTCLQLKDDKKDRSQILKQEIKTIPGNNLVFIRPSNPSILINSQWVLEQHKASDNIFAVASHMLFLFGGKWKAPALQFDTMTDYTRNI